MSPYRRSAGKGLVIGEPADQAAINEVRTMPSADPRVTAVNHVRTIHVAPEKVFVALSVDFEDSKAMGEGEALEECLRGEMRELSSIIIRPETERRAQLAAVRLSALAGPSGSACVHWCIVTAASRSGTPLTQIGRPWMVDDRTEDASELFNSIHKNHANGPILTRHAPGRTPP